MDCSAPGLSVLHHLPEIAQIHVHWVGDAIQPSHTLSPSSRLSSSPKFTQLVSGKSQFQMKVCLLKNELVVAKGEGIVREFEMDMYTLLFLKW